MKNVMLLTKINMQLVCNDLYLYIRLQLLIIKIILFGINS